MQNKISRISFEHMLWTGKEMSSLTGQDNVLMSG